MASKTKKAPVKKHTTAAKRPAKVKAPRGAARKPALRDVFGFGIDTQAFQFGKMLLRKNGSTMKEVRAAEWNKGGWGYYTEFKKLMEKGLVKKIGDRMMATATARKRGSK